MHTKALFHLKADKSAIQNINLGKIENGLVIQSLYSMISTGTELKVAKGEIDNRFLQRMAVPYMEGDFSLPIKYGYSLVGKVISKGHWENKLVQLLHPHQDRCVVKQSDVSMLPDNLPALRASLTSNMETVVNAIWDAEVQPGQTALICGFGNIGSLLALTLQLHFQVQVFVIEKNEWRINEAKKLGFIVNKAIQTSVAFNTTANENGLQTCINHVEKEGKVVELSWYGNKKVNLQLGESFHYDRKQIISSQVSSIPLKKQSEWNFLKRKQYVFELLNATDYDEYITQVIPFEDCASFFNDLRNKPNPENLIWCIEY